jgi:antitoxin component YwqK of YwqJK toxin-antitoxin module
MKTTLFILIMFATMLVKGQRTEVITKYENGDIQQIGYLDSNNQKDSLWLMYNRSGIVLGKAHYKNGNKVGVWEIFDNNGLKLIEIIYSDGKKISGKQWENGILVSTKNY